MDGIDRSTSYEQRVSTLFERGLVERGFSGPADEAIDRGTLAVAVVKILGWKGGINRALLGATPRYAFRTLQFRGVYPGGSPNQLVSGAEFVGILGRVEDIRRKEGVERPAHQLPGEVARGDNAAEPIHAMAAFANAPSDLVNPLLHSAGDSSANTWRWGGLDPLRTVLTGMLMQQPPGTGPATAPTTPDGAPIIRITGIEGPLAQVRLNDNSGWTPATVGMSLPVGAALRTGPASAIRLEIAPDQTLTLDRFGSMRLVEANRESGRMATDVTTAYGRIRYSLEPLPQYPVQGAGLEHSSTIRTPNSTLAVRGTRVIVFDQPPYVPAGISLTGRAYYTNARGQFVAFGGAGAGIARIRRDAPSAAATAFSETVVDPSVGYARTQEEAALVAALISRGAVVTFDRGRGINVVRGGTVPGTRQLRRILPGQLNFIVRWSGNANLDLAVGSPLGQGELLYPAPGLTRTASGGRTAFDHQGGKGGGIEVGYWSGSFPEGPYGVAVQHISGGAADVTIDAFVNGRRLRFLGPDGFSCVTQFTDRVSAQNPVTGAPVGVGSDLCLDLPFAKQHRPTAVQAAKHNRKQSTHSASPKRRAGRLK